MNALALVRLLRLASPALPIGTFAYSQALEWAAESGAVCDEASAAGWLGSLLETNMARFELPYLLWMHGAWASGDTAHAVLLDAEYLASRETAELRAETRQMGVALCAALEAGGDCRCDALRGLAQTGGPAFPSAFAFAAANWSIPPADSATAYAWAWLENQVTAAIKLVPLGQSAGQHILAGLAPRVAQAVEVARRTGEDELSNFAPLFAIASSRHETQYTRLFRS